MKLTWVSGCAISAAGIGALAQNLRFEDQTEASGLLCLRGQYNRMAGGGGAGDFNNDGWQDLFVLGGANEPDRLFINNGDGTFTDRAQEWGVAYRHYGFGVAIADYDGDGWQDVFITSGGPKTTPDALFPGRHILYRNNGDGSFTDVAQKMGLAWTSTNDYNGWGAAWGDYDLDGDLDLGVSGWIHDSQPANCLFRNDADAGFVLISPTALVDESGDPWDFNNPNTRGFCPMFADMNGDRYPELLWVSDFLTSRYFINNTDGTLTEFTVQAGAGLDGNGMGSAVNDVDNDGDLDWYVSSIFGGQGPTIPGDGNKLYLNRGDGTFDEIAKDAGVDDGGWAWGNAMQDFDHDGWVDIVATNGWSQDLDYRNEQSYLWLNNGDLTFREVALSVGIEHRDEGRGLLTFDADNDGDQDIVILSAYADLRFYRNQLAGEGTHWLRVKLDRGDSRAIAPDGYGATVRAIAGDLTLTRQVCGGTHFLSQSELIAHFGLASRGTIDQLIVDWPDGRRTSLANVSSDQTLSLSYCVADFAGGAAGGGDGVLDPGDFLAFLDAFAAGLALADLTGGAEGDQGRPDGTLDSADFFYYLDAYVAGCP